MSKSYRSEPLAYKVLRLENTSTESIRVKERKPREGDVHPLSASLIRRFLNALPFKYLIGLTEIELRPRVGLVGELYGSYTPSEKKIILYSLPCKWRFPYALSSRRQREYIHAGAIVNVENKHTDVSWARRIDLERWFCCETFLHEVGHHYIDSQQYRKKIPLLHHEELLADLHSSRAWKDLLLGLEIQEKEK